jgi:DNA-binding beta-propeller fold protein YncE
MGCTAGVAGETVSYWVADCQADLIYQVGYLSGSVVNSFPAPGSRPMGLAFRSATTMYHTDNDNRMLYVLHPLSGSVYSSYRFNFRPCDLGYDGRGYLWVADGLNRLVRQCDLTGSTLASFSVASYGLPSGLAYYNKQVWVGINAPLHSILKFEVDPEYAVAPASIGRVKALFR